MAKKLTPKQKLFVKEYVVDLNGRKAALRAGYGAGGAASQASRMLQRPEFKVAIAKLQTKIGDKLEITVEYVLDKIRRSAEMADATNQHGSALKGWELLGKHLGMFRENHNLFSDGELKIKLKWDNGNGD